MRTAPRPGKSLTATLAGCGAATVVYILACMFGGWIFQILWNAVVAGIFEWYRPLGYWEALAVWALIITIGGAFKTSVSSKS